MIATAGGIAAGRQWDVADPEAVRQAVAAMQTEFGGVDVLVNNTAWFPARASLAEIPEETWEKCLAVNVTGPFLMSRCMQWFRMGVACRRLKSVSHGGCTPGERR